MGPLVKMKQTGQYPWVLLQVSCVPFFFFFYFFLWSKQQIDILTFGSEIHIPTFKNWKNDKHCSKILEQAALRSFSKTRSRTPRNLACKSSQINGYDLIETTGAVYLGKTTGTIRYLLSSSKVLEKIEETLKCTHPRKSMVSNKIFRGNNHHYLGKTTANEWTLRIAPQTLELAANKPWDGMNNHASKSCILPWFCSTSSYLVFSWGAVQPSILAVVFCQHLWQKEITSLVMP